ncbi:hypothetical protein FDP41_012249 [Naegleria fowleri]|uniref:Ornithine decarboxylase antizyme n=1 Tax=Naegleria fowleri TaxID=5763 RepID=A0A6A5C4A0_NAEFO|nr:uncharacterized protein FDP41_012249 [Naegleria fowleri]KAF0981592.1 hypothetical protein FDP41_012249 [Naegleria fowleri]CAG4715847.1 unnamed protein product [Naegleria fowleri]
MTTAEGLAVFDVAMFALKQVDFSYRPLAMDSNNHNSHIDTLIQQLDQSMNFIASTTHTAATTTTSNNTTTSAGSNTSSNKKLAFKQSVMFVYNAESLDDDSDDDEYEDDVLSTSSSDDDSAMSLELSRAIRTGFTGIIDFEKNEMMIYPPSHSAYLHKDSIINLMDIAESICCSTIYICMEKNHPEVKEFARGFIYAGFQLVQPSIKKLNPTEWVLFGAEL